MAQSCFDCQTLVINFEVSFTPGLSLRITSKQSNSSTKHSGAKTSDGRLRLHVNRISDVLCPLLFAAESAFDRKLPDSGTNFKESALRNSGLLVVI